MLQAETRTPHKRMLVLQMREHWTLRLARLTMLKEDDRSMPFIPQTSFSHGAYKTCAKGWLRIRVTGSPLLHMRPDAAILQVLVGLNLVDAWSEGVARGREQHVDLDPSNGATAGPCPDSENSPDDLALSFTHGHMGTQMHRPAQGWADGQAIDRSTDQTNRRSRCASALSTASAARMSCKRCFGMNRPETRDQPAR